MIISMPWRGRLVSVAELYTRPAYIIPAYRDLSSYAGLDLLFYRVIINLSVWLQSCGDVRFYKSPMLSGAVYRVSV